MGKQKRPVQNWTGLEQSVNGGCLPSHPHARSAATRRAVVVKRVMVGDAVNVHANNICDGRAGVKVRETKTRWSRPSGVSIAVAGFLRAD